MMRILELAAVVIVLIGAAFTAFFTLNNLHATKQELQSTQAQLIEAEREIIRMALEVTHDATSDSLKQDAAAAAYYRDIERDPDLYLTEPEHRRKEFVESQVERKQRKIEMLEMRQMQLEASE